MAIGLASHVVGLLLLNLGSLMKICIALSLCLFSFVIPPQTGIKLEIGAKLSRKLLPKVVTEELMTHSGQTRPYIKRTIKDVEYLIAYDEKTREITYIHTSDKNFRTADGLRVMSEIPVKRDQLQAFPGWAIWAPMTSDGWYPVLEADVSTIPDFIGGFKDDETKMVTIAGFAKGGN